MVVGGPDMVGGPLRETGPFLERVPKNTKDNSLLLYMARDVHSVMSHEQSRTETRKKRGLQFFNLQGMASCNSLKELGDGSIPGSHM